MIEVKELRFAYTRRRDVIHGLSFAVGPGEVFGFLGPSGAGKSTLQKILSGILRAYRGSVRVLGTEVKHRTSAFYERIGMAFELPNLYGKFTALENLRLFGSLYARPGSEPLTLLERVGLAQDAHKAVGSFSKGMKLRLAFVRALLHQPALLFLDEPTGGLDPGHARIIKDMVLEQKRAGATILLTTHNMHAAEELCDRVAFIVDGRIRGLDTPHALRVSKGGIEVAYTFREGGQAGAASAMLSALHLDAEFMRRLHQGALTSIRSKEPTLEDVFIELTGRGLQ
ncbi:MAG: ABC transporter ATP-binding protein [Bacillota bacterium]